MLAREKRGILCLLLALCGGCAGDSGPVDQLQPPPAVTIQDITPGTVLPRTSLLIQGRPFTEGAVHSLGISGQMVRSSGSTAVERTLPLTPTSGARATVLVDDHLFASLGEGRLQATFKVISHNSAGSVEGPPRPLTLVFSRTLTPTLSDLGDGLVYLNSKVQVVGSGMLLGSPEGISWAELQGCFLADGKSPPCASNGAQVKANAEIKATNEGQRSRGTFLFAPTIAGIAPGTFSGNLRLHNNHAGGQMTSTAWKAASFYLDRTRLDKLAQQSASLAQYLLISGAGFVGGKDGSTAVMFNGNFTPSTGGKARAASFSMVPTWQNGGSLSYVLEEKLGLGSVVDLRQERGILTGTWSPRIFWAKSQLDGVSAQLTLKISGVKQVVWVRFDKEWQSSLQRFGMQAADGRIRTRMVETMRYKYKGINVDIRIDEPKDFKLFAKVDIRGKDPNGLGLLGYDNSPGKDVGNLRLYDWIGGVNAQTQQDGYPGYGGVFLESLLGFSQHPPQGVTKAPLNHLAFDQIFDPFRPDMGQPMTSAEALQAKALTSGAGCPAGQGDRIQQAACAIWALGNIIGSTSAHELGHSLGLANPSVAKGNFHNPGDVPNRLMDAGNARPFEERAQLNGKGPAVFCKDEFKYLQSILPLDPQPKDPESNRPGCQ